MMDGSPLKIHHFPTFMQNPIHTWEIDEGNFVGSFLKQMKLSTLLNTTNYFHAFEQSCFHAC